MSYQLYDALVAAGAPEEKAKAAAESIPEGQYLASKEDLQEAFGEVAPRTSASRMTASKKERLSA